MEHRHSARVLAVGLAALMFCFALSTNSCKATAQSLAEIEAMPDADFLTIEARADLITRVLAARLVTAGKVPPSALTSAATALELAAGDPFALAGSSVIGDALAKAGFTEQETILAIVLLEDFLRSRFKWGEASTPLGPHARHLLQTIATSLRAGAAGKASDADKSEAASILPATDKN